MSPQCGASDRAILCSSQKSSLASKGCLGHLSFSIDQVKSAVESILETLFLARDAGNGSTYTQVLLLAASLLLVMASAILLAHRNDLGWWALIVAAFTGPVITAMQFDLFGLLYAIPLLLLAIFGLWRFSLFRLTGKFTRVVTRTPLTAWTVLGVAMGIVLLVALRFGPNLFNSLFLSATADVWVMFAAEAAIYASFVMIARGVRAGWLLLAAAAIADLIVYFTVSPMLGMMGLLVFIALAALYGFFLWRALPAAGQANEPAAELDEAGKALDAAKAATLEKLNKQQDPGNAS